MSIINLTPTQLREAADLKEQIAKLENQLEQLQGTKAAPVSVAVPKPPKRKITAAHIAKIRAAQKLRWAKVKAAKAKAAAAPKAVAKPGVAALPAKPARKKISPEGLARIKAAQKARWAKFKAAAGKK